MKDKIWLFIYKFFSLIFYPSFLFTMEIDMKEVDGKTIKRFEDKNLEYRQPFFFAHIYQKYFQYFSLGYIVAVVLYIILSLFGIIPPFFSIISEDMHEDHVPELWAKFLIFTISICLIYFFISAIFCLLHSKDITKINYRGIFYKNFYNKENLITWEDLEDVKQTFINFMNMQSCIIILKNKDIFRRYIVFNIQRKFISLWSKEIDEVCKFIKFKIEENKNQGKKKNNMVAS